MMCSTHVSSFVKIYYHASSHCLRKIFKYVCHGVCHNMAFLCIEAQVPKAGIKITRGVFSTMERVNEIDEVALQHGHGHAPYHGHVSAKQKPIDTPVRIRTENRCASQSTSKPNVQAGWQQQEREAQVPQTCAWLYARHGLERHAGGHGIGRHLTPGISSRASSSTLV